MSRPIYRINIKSLDLRTKNPDEFSEMFAHICRLCAVDGECEMEIEAQEERALTELDKIIAKMRKTMLPDFSGKKKNSKKRKSTWKEKK